MLKRLKNFDKRWPCCSCLSMLFVLVFIISVTYFIRKNVAESTVFLRTENITLEETYDFNSRLNDTKNTWVIYPSSSEYVIPEDTDFLVYTSGNHVRGIYFDPAKTFRDNIRYEFYRVIKTKNDEGKFNVETEFLGSIHTNLYFYRQISVSPDGEYIMMSARAVDSRSLGKFRNKMVLLKWKIGKKVVEKDVVDWRGKKISIIIKTEEE